MPNQIDQLSETRKDDLIVQVCFIGGPMDCRMYAREAVITEKKGWSDWAPLKKEIEREIDKRALKLANNGDASPFYAQVYIDLIS